MSNIKLNLCCSTHENRFGGGTCFKFWPIGELAYSGFTGYDIPSLEKKIEDYIFSYITGFGFSKLVLVWKNILSSLLRGYMSRPFTGNN